MAGEEQVRRVGEVLVDVKRPLKARFRALFTLKNLGGDLAVDAIAEVFSDKSALLKHEAAYCLGQVGNTRAVRHLVQVLDDEGQESIVRHEAGEALGALGQRDPATVAALARHAGSTVQEVAETCQLALARLDWLHGDEPDKTRLISNPYNTVDPAPSSTDTDLDLLARHLLDDKLTLFDRYRAMFALRNLGSDAACRVLAGALNHPGSALFRHEVAYVLGQMSNKVASDALMTSVADHRENGMVRHESAEALGQIADDNGLTFLRGFLSDGEDVVRESCEVALDIGDSNVNNEFNYANTLHHS